MFVSNSASTRKPVRVCVLPIRFTTTAWSSSGRPPPVLRDVAEHPVFDLVPLARPGREVTHRDLQSRLIRQILEADLPQSVAPPVAPARVGRDQQLLRL